MRQIAVLGIDLGKNSCSLAGLDASGAVVLRRRTGRQGILALAERLPPCVVAMEACCGPPPRPAAAGPGPPGAADVARRPEVAERIVGRDGCCPLTGRL